MTERVDLKIVSARLLSVDELGVVATVIGVGIAAIALWFQVRSHRRENHTRGRVGSWRADASLIVSVANSWPTFASGDIGDWYVTVKAYNNGERPVTVDGWGFELPGGGSLFQLRPVEWSPQLPCRLDPGDKAEFWMPAEGLRESLAERKIKFAETRSWVRLASDEKVYGPPAPVADE